MQSSTGEYTSQTETRSETSVPNWELEHAYGARVHILDNGFLSTALARFGDPEVGQTEMLQLLRTIYRTLCVAACGRELPLIWSSTPTRMAATHPEAGHCHGQTIDPATPVVVADIIRAGIVPSQVCFELLCSVMPAERVRLDHLTMARVSDGEGRVTGVDLSDSKIGGSVEGAVLVVPDPMGATGSTLLRALQHYRERYGEPARVIAMPMICTPEYLRASLAAHEQVVVYTGRLDRGLSSPRALAGTPGEYWDEERGLDDTSYIVPGAGGVGEVLNNSWC